MTHFLGRRERQARRPLVTPFFSPWEKTKW